jgi:HEAT repeat protein
MTAVLARKLEEPMAKSRRLEERLAELMHLRDDPTSEQTLAALQKALVDKDNFIVTRAAEMVREFYLNELESTLVRAFEKFMVNPVKTDPGCSAKTAIAETLYRLESYQSDVFLRGISHRQMEPVWGGQEDTAAKLRGVCALGLVRMNYPNVMIPLAHLLADEQADARISAARAIGYSGLEEGVPLLRFKALTGDTHPKVLCDSFGALMKLAPESSLSFVAGFMKREDSTIVEAAALALGESQLTQALPFLEEAWEDTFDRELRKTFLMSIALLKQEKALEFLENLIIEGPRVHAQDAHEALIIYRNDQRIWQRVEKALQARGEKL